MSLKNGLILLMRSINENKLFMIRIKKDSIITSAFALSFVLTTMTRLRIPGASVGPGELLMLISSCVSIVGSRQEEKKSSYCSQAVMKYWVVFFISLLLGTLVNLLTIKRGLSFRSVVAYLLCALVSYSLVKCYGEDAIKLIIKKTIIFGTVIFFLLFFYAKFGSRMLLGISLLYGSRFTGGANNPNQLALFISPIPFLATFFANSASKSKKSKEAFVWIAILAASIYIGAQTKSDGIIGAWSIAFVYLIYRFIFYRTNSLVRIGIIILFFLVILVFFRELIINVAIDWFKGLDEGGSRAVLWVGGLKAAIDSLLIGYGPGSFSLESNECHNTFIDLLTQGGIIALINFGYLLFLVFNNVKNNVLLSSSIVCICAFIFGHFAGRQPILYLYLMFLLAYDSTLSVSDTI